MAVEPNETAEMQQRFIADARELLKPSEVRLHHVPDWFRRVLLKAYGPDFLGSTSGESVLRSAIGKAGGGDDYWLDHWGSTTIYGQSCFVSEPYQLSLADLHVIESLARATKCNWSLSANSWWYPSQTIRVVFSIPRQTPR